MTTITFDTLKFAERLEKAGASRELASAIAEAQKEAFSETLDTSVATKADVATLRADLAKLENQLLLTGSRLEAMEYRLTIKLGAFLVTAVGVLIAVLKAF